MSLSPETAAELARIRARTELTPEDIAQARDAFARRAAVATGNIGAGLKKRFAASVAAAQENRRATRLAQVRAEHAEAVARPKRPTVRRGDPRERAARNSRKPSREALVALWARHGTLTGCAKELGYKDPGMVRGWLRAEGIIGELPRNRPPKPAKPKSPSRSTRGPAGVAKPMDARTPGPGAEVLAKLMAEHGTVIGVARALGYTRDSTVRRWLRAAGIRQTRLVGDYSRKTGITVEIVRDAVAKHGSMRAAAKALGCSRDLVGARMAEIEQLSPAMRGRLGL